MLGSGRPRERMCFFAMCDAINLSAKDVQELVRVHADSRSRLGPELQSAHAMLTSPSADRPAASARSRHSSLQNEADLLKLRTEQNETQRNP